MAPDLKHAQKKDREAGAKRPKLREETPRNGLRRKAFALLRCTNMRVLTG